MLSTYFVWVPLPPLLGGFWYQWLQSGAEMNELFLVDAKKTKRRINGKETTEDNKYTMEGNSSRYHCFHFTRVSTPLN